MAFVTLKQIAEVVGVSVNTVSRAINNKPDVSKETRQRVLEAAKRLGYVPNRSALSLRRQKSHIVGVIIEDNANPFWAEVLRGIESAAKSHGYHVILVNTSREYQNEVEGIQMLLERRVDGLLIAPNQERYDDIYELMEMEDFPFVIMGRHIKEFEKLGIPMIYSDEIKGGYMATRYLIERGCKKIAFIGAQPYNTASIERCKGYKKALREAGIKVERTLIKTGGIEIEGGYNSIMSLIKRGKGFDGVFAYNDLMAFGVLKALREVGLKVPRDVRVIGYDDIPYASIVTPPLPTIRIRKREMGEKAFKILINKERKQEVLDIELVARETQNENL